MYYVIAYDICEPRRLRRVAKLLEQHALRRQKSVFLFSGSPSDVLRLLEKVRPELNETEDTIQAWRLNRDESTEGVAIGQVTPAAPAILIALPEGLDFIDSRHDP